jgi:ABC-type branched-subunit amino acid transport system ATPase component
MNALEVNGLVAGYGEAMVLRDVSLHVATGEVLAVLGKNGMGKSTLLKAIMGFLPARSGAIRLFADDKLRHAPHLLASRGLAYSPQDQAIFQDLTVEENLRVGLPRGIAFAAGLERIAGFFPFLARRRRQRAGTLSGGEQKMLIIGRALLARPRLMLIDEITEGLQPSVILRLSDVLRAEQQAGGTAILLVEQNVRFALSLADRYAVLARGEIVAEGAAGAPDAEAQVAEHLSV